MSTDEEERRRKEDRRHDPNAWSPEHRKNVKLIFGMAVGGFFFAAGTIVIIWIITNETITNLAAGLGLAMWAMGGLAAFPSVAIPIVSAILKKVPGFGDVKIPVPEVTEILPSITEEDE